MKVWFRGKSYEFEEGMKVKELLKKMNLLPEYVLVIKRDGDNFSILPEDEYIGKEEEVEILSAISGG